MKQRAKRTTGFFNNINPHVAEPGGDPLARVVSNFIGIDPGANTGFAIWDAIHKKIVFTKTYTFWDCIEHLILLNNKPNFDFVVVIEKPSGNKPTFSHHTRNREKISQNVGENKRDEKLIVDFCVRNEIPVFPITPGKYSMTGMKQGAFNEHTGYLGSTSGHARDAAMLVFNRKPMNLNKIKPETKRN